MQTIKHNEMVTRLVKPGKDILAALTPSKVDLLHLATGIFVASASILNAAANENDLSKWSSGMGTQQTTSREDFLMDLNHAAVGIATEAGELLDAVKKMAVYNKALDTANVIEELGDLAFYVEQWEQNPLSQEIGSMEIIKGLISGVETILGVSHQEVLDANIAKLRVRYEGLIYTDQRAHDRADKQG